MTQILFKRGNTAQNDAFVGSIGSITIDTQARKIRIHDGVTFGGHVVANMADVQAVIDSVNGLVITDIAGLETALSTLTTDKADKTVNIAAGNGITGGGTLAANRTITLGTPSTVSGSSTNSVTASSHTHELTITKSDVGLSNVDNTSDTNKPVSTATQNALDLKLNTSLKGTANGLAELDAGGKVPLSQISDTVLGQVEYMGTWNASTNSPTLPTTPTKKGDYYVVSTGGTRFSLTFDVGDWIISDGTKWDKVDNTDAVTSVAGRIGAVVLTKSDVGLNNVDNTSDANKPVSTAQQSALDLKADLDSPTLTGTPLAPTATTATNTTQIATTAFVQARIGQLDTGVSSVSGTAPIVVSGTTVNPIVTIDNVTTTTDGAMSSGDKSKLDGIETGAQVNTVTSVAGRTGSVVVSKSDVGLGNVENYGVATTAEAQAATLDIKYMTPLKTSELIDEYTIDCGTF